MAKTKKSPKLTRSQARAVKTAVDQLTKAEEVYNEGQLVAQRGPTKEKIRVLSTEEQMMRHWAVYDGVLNRKVPLRMGVELLQHGPLGQLRLVEARERDNGKRVRGTVISLASRRSRNRIGSR